MNDKSEWGPVGGRGIDVDQVVQGVCELADQSRYIKTLRERMGRIGLRHAIKEEDTDRIYDWMMESFSYTGIADSIVRSFIDKHGNARFEDVASALTSGRRGSCSKLAGFDAYVGCGYRKAAQRCARPTKLRRCPVPTLPLRKGQLNQLAFALFFFIRDVCDGNPVAFIDRILAEADRPGHPDRLARMRRAFLGQFLRIHGVSGKLLCMSFADLMIGAGYERPRWFEVGTSLIAIDSLVHNFLHRTGILHRRKAQHAYGSACYGPNGCARVIDAIARKIDCRALGPEMPTYFPRLIQHAIWQFCAADEHDICNGNNIDDDSRCALEDCPLYASCGRIPLR